MTLINGGQTPRSLKSNILVVKERVPTLIQPTSKLVYAPMSEYLEIKLLNLCVFNVSHNLNLLRESSFDKCDKLRATDFEFL